MSAFAFLLFVVLTPSAFAEGTCVSHADKGAHEGFCNNLNKQTCGVHSSTCTWENAKVKTLQIVGKTTNETMKVIEKVEHHCTAKDGMEVHETFCANQNKMTCSGHSMCQWE